MLEGASFLGVGNNWGARVALSDWQAATEEAGTGLSG